MHAAFSTPRYQAFLNGLLLISGVTRADERRRFRCVVENSITGEKMESQAWGKVIVTGESSFYAQTPLTDSSSPLTQHILEILSSVVEMTTSVAVIAASGASQTVEHVFSVSHSHELRSIRAATNWSDALYSIPVSWLTSKPLLH